ncbi:MAG: apolipoprotein N-acyltransferase [Propionibacteriaceae bacterium]|nr:apolipoprotein N-acyltransferase [Propionibacteriaceae bacterium]
MLIRPALPVLVTLPLAVVVGLLVGAGQAPMGLWPLTLIGVAGFAWLMAGRGKRAAFGLGYLAGLAANTLTVSWISVLGVWVGVALIAFLSLWWGLLGLALSRITRLRAWPLLAPAAWVAMEFAAGKVPFGGFSWARLGYTAVDQPLSGWYAWVGIAGVSYLVALIAHLLLLAVLKWVAAVKVAVANPSAADQATGVNRAAADQAIGVNRAAAVKAVAFAVVPVVAGGLLNLVPIAEPTEHVTVAMVQPNVNRVEKGTGSYARSVTNNALSETIYAVAEARAAGTRVSFVLWPENATDVDPILDAETRGLVETAAAIADIPIFVGAVTEGPVPDSRQTTSLWWDPETGPGEAYHKRDLVPFGEWIPFRDFLLPRMPILKQIGRQSIPGEEPGVITGPVEGFPDLQVGTIICFELAYDDTSYDVVRHGAQVVVSQSNTNTYGGTFQVHQQLTINRVRAMELGREIAASTLNSVSSLIDAKGRVVDPTAEFTADTRIFEMGLRDNVNLSVRVAPILSWAALIVTLGAVVGGSLRKPRDAE